MYTIILIDDEKAIVDRMKQAIPFEKLDLSLVSVAYNGIDGFNQIEELLPDIILCDISMPQMTGFTMLENVGKIQNYNPVVILVTGHNDFEHAKKAIQYNVFDYLVKPVMPNELYDTLNRAVDLCKKNSSLLQSNQAYNNNMCLNLVEKLLHHGTLSIEEMMSLKQFGISLTSQHYVVLKLQIANYNNLCNNIGSDRLNEIKSSILSKFTTSFEHIYNTHFNIDEIYFLIEDNSANISRLENTCLELLSELNFENTRIFLMLSNYCNKPEQLPQLLSQTDYCTNFVFCFNKSTLLVYDKIFSYMQHAFEQNIFQDFDVEMSASVTWDFGQIEKHMSALNNITQRFEYYDPNYIKNIAYRSLSTLISNFFNHNTDTQKDMVSTLWNDISDTKSIYELIELYSDVVSSMSTVISETTAQRYKRLSEQIKKYIADNYMHPISISVLAETLYISDRTIRRVFQSENGITINDYLQKYRINKAYDLLLSKQYKTYEVAALVGYNDLKSFRKAFIQHFGKSPSQVLSEQKS